MSEPVPSVDEIVALPAGTCKYLLIKLLHPEIKDAEAGRLAGYKGKAGGNLKARVAGVLGPYLEAEGLTLESIATVLQEAMNATKIKEVVVKKKLSTGMASSRQIDFTQEVEKVDLGPDHKVRLQAGALLMNLHRNAERDKPPGLPPPPKQPVMTQDQLQKAVGRGPTEVVDAEFEVEDAATG